MIAAASLTIAMLGLFGIGLAIVGAMLLIAAAVDLVR